MKIKIIIISIVFFCSPSLVHAQKAWAVVNDSGVLLEKSYGIDVSSFKKDLHQPGHYEMCIEDKSLTKPLPIIATLGGTARATDIRYTQTSYSDDCFLIRTGRGLGWYVDSAFTVAVLDIPLPPDSSDPTNPNNTIEIARITLSEDARSLASYSGNVDPTYTGLSYETQYGNGFGKDAFKIRNLTALTPPYSKYKIESLVSGVGLHSDFFPTNYVGEQSGGTYWYIRCVNPNHNDISENGPGGIIDCPGGGTFRLIEE